MPNDIVAPQWSEAKGIDPAELARRADAFIDAQCQKHNANPLGFRKELSSGAGSMFCELSNPTGQSPEDKAKPAPSSSFVMMGKTAKKGQTTMSQLLSHNNAMGLEKSYSEKKVDAKRFSRIAAGSGKGSKDPFAGAGDKDRALKEEMNQIAENLRVFPNNLKVNPEAAKAIGVGDQATALVSARSEETNATSARLIAGALDGNEKLSDQAGATVSKQVISEALAQAPDVPTAKIEKLLGADALKGPNAILKGPGSNEPKPAGMNA